MTGIAGEGDDWFDIPIGMTGKGKCCCLTTVRRVTIRAYFWILESIQFQVTIGSSINSVNCDRSISCGSSISCIKAIAQ
eukprot:1331964-Ditylum_brightwellii.AAC.1